jgi:hypothetical protein
MLFHFIFMILFLGSNFIQFMRYELIQNGSLHNFSSLLILSRENNQSCELGGAIFKTCPGTHLVGTKKMSHLGI